MLGARSRCMKLFRFILFLTFALAIVSEAAQKLPTPSTANIEKWEKSIAAFETNDKTNAPPKNGILFIGSSSIKRWSTLEQDFPNFPVFNRGFGGSQVADSLHFANRIVLPYEPRQIVMFAGSNDLNAKKSPLQVFADYRAFVRRVHKSLPQTRISYIAITPCEKRIKQIEQVHEANRLVAEFAKKNRKLDFIDTASRMVDSDGNPLPDIFAADKLHLNEKGYAIWTRIIRPYLK